MVLKSISAAFVISLGLCVCARAADPHDAPKNGAESSEAVDRGMLLDAWQSQQHIPGPPIIGSTTGAWMITGSATSSFSLAEEPKTTGGTNQITNSIGMKLTLVPSGEFMMGSGESAATVAFFRKNYGMNVRTADAFKDEHPQHRVRITKPFYLGTYHVTRGQFRQFVKDSGYKTDAEKGKNPRWSGEENDSWQNLGFTPGFEQTDEHPVVCVSWNDAVAFCKWLSKKENKTYRLPTEAEWEYACRAGTKTRYYSGDDPETLANVANVADATLKAKFPNWDFATIKASDGYVFTSPVGRFKPNAFGLFDMHGNVCHWCADWYGEDYYSKSPADDPKGPDTGEFRVLRGGSWASTLDKFRSASRGSLKLDNSWNSTGFRVARNQDAAPTTAAEKPPAKIWNHTGPLGDTPKHVTKAAKRMWVAPLSQN